MSMQARSRDIGFGGKRNLICALAILAVIGTFSDSHGMTFQIRPIVLENYQDYSMVASGTITTAGGTSTITGWNAKVTASSRLAHYYPANTVNMSSGPLSCDGTHLLVATSPDGYQDGGQLFFRSSNPNQDFGVAVADFTGPYADGGQAMYMAGAAFDFLPLNQPNNVNYVAATRSTGNTYVLVTLDFYSARITGTITTDGTIGPLAPSHILAWDISVDEVTEDTFTQSNSSLVSNMVDLNPPLAALTVMNPDGYLTFSKGYFGGHLWGLTLADFSAQAPPGGQAGYFHGNFSVTVVNLNAPPGPWIVADADVASVLDADDALSSIRIAPNPVRGSTGIQYSVREAGRTRIEIVDLLGRRVLDPVDELQSPGEHSVRIDVSGLSPGIYFCRLHAGGDVSTGKLLVGK